VLVGRWRTCEAGTAKAQSATGTARSGEEQVILASLEGLSANGVCIQAITNKLPSGIKALKAGVLQHVQR